MNSSNNETVGVTILKKRNRQAYEILYAEFNSQFYGIALQLLGDKDLAEEMMVLIFTNIWRDLEKFNGDNSQLKTLCISVLIRSIRNYNATLKTPEKAELPEREFIKIEFK